MLHRSAPPLQGPASENCWRSSRTMAANSAGTMKHRRIKITSITISNILGAPHDMKRRSMSRKIFFDHMMPSCHRELLWNAIVRRNQLQQIAGFLDNVGFAGLQSQTSSMRKSRHKIDPLSDEHSGKKSNKCGN